MAKLVLILFFTLIGSTATYAQDDIIANLEKDAKKMIASIAEEDYATYIDYTYSNIIELYGGKDIMVKMTKENKDHTKSSGMVLQSTSFKSSEPIINGGEDQLQSLVAFDYIVKINGEDYEGINYLLAISTDKGDTWQFVELETYDAPSIKEFVPTISPDFVFPQIYGASYKGK